MRRLSIAVAMLAVTASAVPVLVVPVLAPSALAEEAGYSGRWLFSGLITGSRIAMSFAQICDLTQTGTQLAGPCHGPNATCSAVGVVNGGQVDLTCRITVPNNPSLDGVITFHGNLAPDGIVRGSWSSSRAAGTQGQASLMRI